MLWAACGHRCATLVDALMHLGTLRYLMSSGQLKSPGVSSSVKLYTIHNVIDVP